jgi:cell division inhibitor SepF
MSGVTAVLDRVKSWLFAEETDGFEPFTADEEFEAPRKRKLIPLHSRAGEIFIRRPRNQDEAKICVDCLRGRRAVIVNLKDVPPEDALRVFDFLAGATYAVGGQIEQAGDKVYLVTPQSIGIMAEETLAQVAPRASFWQEI